MLGNNTIKRSSRQPSERRQTVIGMLDNNDDHVSLFILIIIIK